MNIEPGQSSRLSNCRIAYHPEWDETLPYVTYRNGTAGRHFATLSEAQEYLAPEAPATDWSEFR